MRSSPEWESGDLLGVCIPAQPEGLRLAGQSFLTDAFRASGVLAADNRVVGITRLEHWSGGSTGRKVVLSVDYEKRASGLHSELFVKFSRDFTDPSRDRARHQMDAEVRFALLSRTAGFPITVPACLFADYHRASGTGILITERVAFGTGVIEPHYEKCRDYTLPEPLEHYRVLTRTLARLAGAHRAGRLGDGFTFDPQRVGERRSPTAAQLHDKVVRFTDFARAFPQLFPKHIVTAAFLGRLAREVTPFPRHEAAIWRFLYGQPQLLALCHWNANIDNAWFWRNDSSALECGLLDWGHVSQMNVAMALWGALSAAEITLWDHHLDSLLRLFADEFQAHGGPPLDLDELKLHLHLYIAIMGLTWLMDVPAYIESQIDRLATVADRFDPRIKEHEAVRTRLHMLTTFLHLWDTQNFGGLLARLPGSQT